MKILIVDDHALFREGLCHVLAKLDNNIMLLQASDFKRAWRLVTENSDLDLLLLDLNLPDYDGFSALERLTQSYPALPVVILSASNRREDIQRSLNGGAMGYIPKESTGSVMISALMLVLSGGIYVPPNLAANTVLTDGQPLPLTPRQLQVLKLITEGYSNKAIGGRLNLAEATVKMHVTAILRILDVDNRTQAVLSATKLGLDLSII